MLIVPDRPGVRFTMQQAHDAGHSVSFIRVVKGVFLLHCSAYDGDTLYVPTEGIAKQAEKVWPGAKRP